MNHATAEWIDHSPAIVKGYEDALRMLSNISRGRTASRSLASAQLSATVAAPAQSPAAPSQSSSQSLIATTQSPTGTATGQPPDPSLPGILILDSPPRKRLATSSIVLSQPRDLHSATPKLSQSPSPSSPAIDLTASPITRAIALTNAVCPVRHFNSDARPNASHSRGLTLRRVRAPSARALLKRKAKIRPSRFVWVILNVQRHL
jgi:hypothetical protein